jgi:hypothetical protein
MLIDHDAALRQQLEEVTQERDGLMQLLKGGERYGSEKESPSQERGKEVLIR